MKLQLIKEVKLLERRQVNQQEFGMQHQVQLRRVAKHQLTIKVPAEEIVGMKLRKLNVKLQDILAAGQKHQEQTEQAPI